ncbi:uncharacterized protein LOC125237385 isoform X2 [Leguminivora glycinivorella]|uniref:uncharacterized protein LOC125237385 isoform X2 n=1 Tax=Leguminivora glycinivorella TaxID=1035111 RepID=UPI00200F0B37|nr:uncharacterized protein LOC125237385 isoform X2 [Leguminivora glycinivorella]
MIEDFSPRRQQEKRPEIINVKELGVQIKQEVEEEELREETMDFDISNNDEFMDTSNVEKNEFKEPQDRLTPQRPEDNSQCSSQESQCSEKPPSYEKDESHLRPSSQNSNYSFNDVIASQTGMYNKGMEASGGIYNKGMEADENEYEPENYEVYEQLAMAYQSDVASNQVPLPSEEGTQRIETVVRRRLGEIKCDWRAGAAPPPGASAATSRPSRWGLKPGEVNIVLTGGSDFTPEPVYRIDTITSRNDNSSGYDEAYMDTYGAMDRLQYGDCFSSDLQSQSQLQSQPQAQNRREDKRGTLDDRIDQALRHTVLGEIAMEPENKDSDADKDKEKGILITSGGGRSLKRVSFADGYKPGQDSDTEEPPAKKRGRARRTGCAWPCPASHPDHVPLWDALPPPPPPPAPRRRPRAPRRRCTCCARRRTRTRWP